jgi:hypothetical protein
MSDRTLPVAGTNNSRTLLKLINGYRRNSCDLAATTGCDGKRFTGYRGRCERACPPSEKGVAFRLRLGKIADRDKRRAKHQANQHDPTVGVPIGVIE